MSLIDWELSLRFTKYLAAAAATSLAVAPAMAAPYNPAASLSLGKSVRAGSTSKHQNDLLGGGIIIAVIAIVAVGVGVYVGVDTKDSPSSP